MLVGPRRRQPPNGKGVTTLASPDKVMGKKLLGCPAGMGWTKDGEGEDVEGGGKGRARGRVGNWRSGWRGCRQAGGGSPLVFYLVGR